MATVRHLEEELKMCERENRILGEKLNVHLDRWGFDRNLLQEEALKTVRDFERKSAEQTYELSKVDLLHGMQIQKNLVLQSQLESAKGEVELLKPQVVRLKSALQQAKEATKTSEQWRKSFDSRQRSYVEAMKRIEGKYRAEMKQLKGRIQHLMSELAELNKEQDQWKRDKVELHTLAVERNKLQTELGKLQASLEKRNRISAQKEQDSQAQKEQVLQELAGHRDLIKTWEMQQEAIEALVQDRDKLLAEKECWAVKEREMQELASDRENLLLQRDEWISQEKALQQLTIERDQLKRKLQGKESQEFYNSLKERDKLAEKLDVVRSHRDEEVKGLIRERDFVWSQMKKIEENYTEKLMTVSQNLLQANQENSKLRCDLQQAQAESNEKMVEMTILKLEAKRAEDDIKRLKESLAALKQIMNQGKATEICSNSENIEEEVKHGAAGSINKLSLQELTSEIEILQKQLNAYKTGSQEGVPPSKEGPEVFNCEDILASDQTFVSQVEQATRMDAEDGMKSWKEVEELRRENENLRVLYGQLEALYKEKQKPEKVARTLSRKKHPTSRNLKIELEAAAALSPSDEDSEIEKVVGKLTRGGSGSRARGLKPKSAEKTTMKELSKQSVPYMATEPEEWERSVKKTTVSSTIKKSMSNSKPPIPSSSRTSKSLNQSADGSMGKVRQKTKRDEDLPSTQDSGMGHYENGLPNGSTRKRKVQSIESDEIQRPSPRPVSANESSYASVRKTRQNSSRKPDIGSANYKTASSTKGSSSFMSNLFSAAFSIPRLNIQSSSVTK